MEALLGLAVMPRVAGVHVQAVGAAVDLRAAHFHQLDQRFFQPAGLGVVFDGAHRRIGLGGGGAKVQALLEHGGLLLVVGVDATTLEAGPE